MFSAAHGRLNDVIHAARGTSGRCAGAIITNHQNRCMNSPRLLDGAVHTRDILPNYPGIFPNQLILRSTLARLLPSNGRLRSEIWA
jgi:hypothetical protein